jgi:hypothetical protein
MTWIYQNSPIKYVLKRTNATIGNRWWSNDKISMKSRECPGKGWVLGRSSIKKDVQ